MCTWTDGKTYDQKSVCTRANICDNDPRIAGHTIDYDDPQSLHNWIDKLNLMCVPRWEVGLISSAYFIGYAVTLLWLPLLADKYGRRKFFIAGAIIDLLFYTLIMLTRSVHMMIAISFLEGLAASCTQAVGYVYIMELLPQSRVATFTAIYSSYDNCFTYLVGEAIII